MYEIGETIVHDSYVEQTCVQSKKEITVEFNKDGELDYDLTIVLTWREDTDTGEKEIVLIEVDDSEVGNKIAEYYDIQEDLSETIGGVIDRVFPKETQERRNEWATKVENDVVEAIQDEGIDW